MVPLHITVYWLCSNIKSKKVVGRPSVLRMVNICIALSSRATEISTWQTRTYSIAQSATCDRSCTSQQQMKHAWKPWGILVSGELLLSLSPVKDLLTERVGEAGTPHNQLGYRVAWLSVGFCNINDFTLSTTFRALTHTSSYSYSSHSARHPPHLAWEGAETEWL